MERAGFWVRALASVIDALAASLVAFFAAWASLIVVAGYRRVPAQELWSMLDERSSYQWTAYLAISIMVLIYYLMEALLARTPGKVVMGLRICDRKGERAAPVNLVCRYIIKHLDMAVLMIGAANEKHFLVTMGGMLAVLLALGTLSAFTPQRLALHDYLAGTAVCFVRSLAETLTPAARERMAIRWKKRTR